MALIEENSLGFKLGTKSCSSCPYGQIIVLQDSFVAGNNKKIHFYHTYSFKG